MNIRFRIGPFTFGKSGARLSIWSRGSGFSIPLSNRNKNQSFSKIRLGIFSFFFNEKKKNNKSKKFELPAQIKEIRKTHKKAYDTWSAESDKKLIILFRQGKTVKS